MDSPEQQAIHTIEQFFKQEVISIRPLDGDHHNDLFLINFHYVVRIPKRNKTDHIFLSRANEFHFYERAHRMGVPVPVIPFFSIDSLGRRVEEYCDGEPLFVDSALMEKDALGVVDSIIELRPVSKKGMEWEPYARFRHYQKGNKSPLPSGFEEDIIRRAMAVNDSHPLVSCHNRLCKENLIRVEGRVLFRDYAFVGMNASLFDLASLIGENSFESPLARKILSYYNGKRLEAEYTYEELEAVILFLDALWYYYHSARYEETGNPIYKEWAERRKKHFLLAFDGHIMGDTE